MSENKVVIDVDASHRLFTLYCQHQDQNSGSTGVVKEKMAIHKLRLEIVPEVAQKVETANRNLAGCSTSSFDRVENNGKSSSSSSSSSESGDVRQGRFWRKPERTG